MNYEAIHAKSKSIINQYPSSDFKFEATNFMTPFEINTILINGMDVEISEGSGFDGAHLFGVTVAINGESKRDLNRCVTIDQLDQTLSDLATIRQ